VTNSRVIWIRATGGCGLKQKADHPKNARRTVYHAYFRLSQAASGERQELRGRRYRHVK